MVMPNSLAISREQQNGPTLFLADGRYALFEVLANTALVTFYHATDTRTLEADQSSSRVVIGVVNPALEQIDGFTSALPRVLNEFTDPTVSPCITDHGLENGRFWFALSNLKGTPLHSYISQTGRFGYPVADTLNTAEQIIRAVRQSPLKKEFGYLEPGAIYYDTESGHCALINSPIVTTLNIIAQSHHGHELKRPTLHSGYLSPEVALGKAPNDYDDSFSLAVIIYQMLNGHLPFINDHTVEAALKKSIPAGLAKLEPESSQVILTALSFRREQRPANGEELLHRIHNPPPLPKQPGHIPTWIKFSTAAALIGGIAFGVYSYTQSNHPAQQALAGETADSEKEQLKLAALQNQYQQETQKLAQLKQLQQEETQRLDVLKKQQKQEAERLAALKQQQELAAKQAAPENKTTTKTEIATAQQDEEDIARRLKEQQEKEEAAAQRLREQQEKETKARAAAQKKQQELEQQLAELAELKKQQEVEERKRRMAEQAQREAEERRIAQLKEQEAEKRRMAEQEQREAEARRVAWLEKQEAEKRRIAAQKQQEAEERRLAEQAQREAEERRVAWLKKQEAEKRRIAAQKQQEAEERRLAEQAQREAEERRVAWLKKQEAEKRRVAAQNASKPILQAKSVNQSVTYPEPAPRLIRKIDPRFFNPRLFGKIPASDQAQADQACRSIGGIKALGFHPRAIGLDNSFFSSYFCAFNTADLKNQTLIASAPAQNSPRLEQKVSYSWTNPHSFAAIPSGMTAAGNRYCAQYGFRRAIKFHPRALDTDGTPIPGGGYLCQ